jgi:membrane protease YdiL (CAAX protease family)
MNDTHHRAALLFILLAYGISWVIWLPLLLNRRFGASLPVSPVQHFIAPYGPLIAGMLAELTGRGKGGISEHLRKIFGFPRQGRWYMIGLGSPWAAFIIAALLRKSILGEFPGIEHFYVKGPGIPENILALWLLWLMSYGLGEETGWRGFLFQHFLKRRSAFAASLLTSLFWAAWHVPAFFFDENLGQMAGFGAVGWLIGLISGSILLSWMTVNAGGSVIPAILWHGTFNTLVAGSDGDPFIAGFCSMLVVGAALYLRIRFGPDLKFGKTNDTLVMKEMKR